ncbi:MAG: asparagine--tRNA ligase [Erysipelotrichaceae bacterium]
MKTIKELHDLTSQQLQELKTLTLLGWVKTNRNNGSIGFIELTDGTCFKSIQLVYDKELSNFDDISKYLTGCAVSIKGDVVLTPNAKQDFEIKVSEVVLLGSCDNEYPLQKKRHSFEYLRELSHLRVRTNTFQAVFRVRSVLSMAIHQFFYQNNFLYLHAPIITANDAEGAGESFIVTNRSDAKYDDDFFGKKASLSVSGQLHAEAFALAFNKVYTFGPTFRAEKSNTSRHAAEFWMIEPEMAFTDLKGDMSIIESLIKYVIEYVLKECPDEMQFFNNFIEKGLIERLEKIINSDFKIMSYTEAVEILQQAKVKFEYPVKWGTDLQSEHERYICEEVINGPVFLIDYPKEIKAFYMRQNADGKTVAACDLLVPKIGEIVGGSQREERIDILRAKMQECHIEEEALAWYLDLRKYGGVEHSGFGVGFERLLMYITGMSNIKDVLPFARSFNNLKY